MNYNKLGDDQTERLAYLAEECAEVIQIVGKILRHGYESFDPTKPDKISNRVLLERELNDILTAVRLLLKHNELDGINLNNLLKPVIGKYFHHQHGQGLTSGYIVPSDGTNTISPNTARFDTNINVKTDPLKDMTWD